MKGQLLFDFTGSGNPRVDVHAKLPVIERPPEPKRQDLYRVATVSVHPKQIPLPLA